MRLTPEAQNWLLDRFTSRLTGGLLEFTEGDTALVSIPLLGFPAAVQGTIALEDLPSVPIAVSGIATSARFVAAGEVVLADLTVRTPDDQDAADADAIVERTDFQRGGLCAVSRVVLRLPRSS